MAKTNGDPVTRADGAAAEPAVLHERVLALEEQLAEVTRQRDQARADLAEYEKMCRVWEETGVAPPRRCEIEQAMRNPVTIDQLIAEIEGSGEQRGA